MSPALPQKICVLDLETSKTSFAHPEESRIAFVGVKVYSLRNGIYFAGKQVVYYLKNICKLEKYLQRFQGIILGHNLYQFDYRVLYPHMSLKGIIEKTVDTLAILYRKNNRRVTGLSLGGLARANNFGEKMLKGEPISELWNKGKRKQVIKYNNNDLILTKALWWKLVTEKNLDIEFRTKDDFGWYSLLKTITINTRDMQYLTGSRSQLDNHSWTRRVKKYGNPIRTSKDKANQKATGKAFGWKPTISTIYHRRYCKKCQKTIAFLSAVQRAGHPHYEATWCPTCKSDLGSIRAEHGFVIFGESQYKCEPLSYAVDDWLYRMSPEDRYYLSKGEWLGFFSILNDQLQTHGFKETLLDAIKST